MTPSAVEALLRLGVGAGRRVAEGAGVLRERWEAAGGASGLRGVVEDDLARLREHVLGGGLEASVPSVDVTLERWPVEGAAAAGLGLTRWAAGRPRAVSEEWSREREAGDWRAAVGEGALGRLGLSAGALVDLPAVFDESQSLARSAGEGIGMMGADATLDPWKALQGDSDEMTRQGYLQALGGLAGLGVLAGMTAVPGPKGKGAAVGRAVREGVQEVGEGIARRGLQEGLERAGLKTTYDVAEGALRVEAGQQGVGKALPTAGVKAGPWMADQPLDDQFTRFSDPNILQIMLHADALNPAAKYGPGKQARLIQRLQSGVPLERWTAPQLEELLGISGTSKMPGGSWSLSASRCGSGGKLMCSGFSKCFVCYARGGQNVNRQSQHAYERNFRSWALDRKGWREGFVSYLQKLPQTKGGAKVAGAAPGGRYPFRWFDSGDIQNREMLDDIIEVAWRTPEVDHWLPTTEWGLASRFMDEVIDGRAQMPPNLVMRISTGGLDQFPQPQHIARAAKANERLPQGAKGGFGFSAILQADTEAGKLKIGHIVGDIPKHYTCPVGKTNERIHACLPKAITKGALASQSKAAGVTAEAALKQPGCTACWHSKVPIVVYPYHAPAGGTRIMRPSAMGPEHAPPQDFAGFAEKSVEDVVESMFAAQRWFQETGKQREQSIKRMTRMPEYKLPTGMGLSAQERKVVEQRRQELLRKQRGEP